MGRRLICHQGGKTRECGPYCDICGTRAVRFSGATCFLCREADRDRKVMGAIVLICLCAALLMMGLASAYGTYVRMNQ
jgi:hypothetical protein